ncbi:2Fe-2S iron-sulfur cluster binding domain-containing protein [Rhodobacter calidifons]|uniref:2Fe-2S iron-sulfur cluster binding domain-containing protein n=1 Tax=Rhodobacter calidifons TaxID=2715277 RepID=A0ABX0G5J4_9RHOB|nr:2Fe-2S iron-sulfur cluster binding domain-containing protein [Rhodobacter calidifons]
MLPGQSLLDAALDAGQTIDFSCLTGGCGSCTVRLVEGAKHVALDTPNSVSPADLAAGIVPACITRLTGPVRFSKGSVSLSPAPA